MRVGNLFGVTSFGHASTTRTSSASLSSTVINGLQPFSGVLVATFGATELKEFPDFPTSSMVVKLVRRSTEPKADQVATES